MHFSLFLLPLILSLPAPAVSEYFYPICDSTTTSTGNYTANSTYQSNINRLFSALGSNSTGKGFAAGTVGTAPDKVSGMLLCRGDIDSSTCSTCLSGIFRDILNLCPYYKTALMWSNSCYLYFSNQYFLSSFDNSPQQPLIDIYNVTVDPARFDQAVATLMSEMTSWAVNNSTKFFATGQVTNFSTEFSTIYGLVQCTPDMPKSQCQGCLQDLIHKFQYSRGRIGARTIGIYCNIRYETAPFYNGGAMISIDGTAPSPSPAPVPPPTIYTGKKKNSSVTILAITIPASAAVLSLAIFGFCLYKKRPHQRKRLISEKVDSDQNIESVDPLLIDLSTLKSATVNFHESNKIGEGGFGAVYKGILPNGQEVAVKRLSQNSSQGLGELKNELVLVAKLQHRNLVRVVGVCSEGQEKLIVYEFLPNRSLDTFLFDDERRQELDWRKRWIIINGVARGLQYLHEDSQLTIVHRDLKASNILLDSDLSPKISDFGLARLFHVDQSVNVTSQVVGTFGYMAPEYAMQGLYSIKSDVFSFGVLLLEVVTGRQNSGSSDDAEHDEDLLSSTWEHWTTSTIIDMIDPLIGCPTNEIIRHIHIGLLCVQEDPIDRPRMSEVVIMLSSNTVSLGTPSKPAFYLRKDGSNSQSVSGDRSLQTLVSVSHNEVSLSELDPR